MRCTVCGSRLNAIQTDLPFKIGDERIVIVKNLPVFQCENCPQYLLEDAVMKRVDEIIAHVDGAAELEVVQFAA